MSSKISWSRAQTVVQNYQNQGPWLRAAPDATGNPQKLRAWWIDLAALQQIISNTPDCDGIRAYICLQDQDETGAQITPYHSIVLVGTQLGPDGAHDNFKPADDMVIDTILPCPKACTNRNPLI
jgi:hypothetical protein